MLRLFGGIRVGSQNCLPSAESEIDLVPNLVVPNGGTTQVDLTSELTLNPKP